MLFRKSIPTWIGVCVFVVSIAMMPLARRWWHPPLDKPRTLVELGASLSRCKPPLHVVWQFEDRPESGMWVCARPRSREQLRRLGRYRECADRWEGIVFCERVANQSPIPESFIRDNWGDYGLHVGPFVLFGDPDLLRRIAKVIEGEPDA
jgi:hypothetical protein